ncbi:MAG TPA: hypothetical protein VLA29_00395 [Acidimicrobiia bacterium]|nr:hypothetical protein [Acidimicrobiia bacterium]
MRRRRTVIGLVIAIALVAAACGDSGSDEGATDPDNVTTTAPDESTTTQPSGSGDGGSGDAGGSTEGDAHWASATIDGVTYTFGDTGFAAQQCQPDFFGVFFAVLYMVDDQGNPNIEGGAINVALLHEDADPAELDQWPEVNVSIADPDLEWIAAEQGNEGISIEPGISQVDSYTIAGNTVSGTASFYERNSYWAVAGGQAEELVTATGTFEVTCGSDS